MKTCTGKERRSSNYSSNVGRLQEETKTQQAKKKNEKKKNYHDTACNIYRTLWKKIQRRKRGLYSTHVR